MKKLKYLLNVMKFAFTSAKTGNGFVVMDEAKMDDILKEHDEALLRADALWQVVDDLIAGKSACAHCEFAEGCLLMCDGRMGCEDWCLKFGEVDADEPGAATGTGEADAGLETRKEP